MQTQMPLACSISLLSLFVTLYHFLSLPWKLNDMSEVCDKICYFYRRWLKIKKVEPPSEDVKELFNQYSEKETMTADLLHKFLEEYQGETDITAGQSAETIIENKKKQFNTLGKKGLSINGFLHYLLGHSNHPLNLKDHDMSAPLAHYFWYTGHSSYLYSKWYEALQKQQQQDQHHHPMWIPPLVESIEFEIYKASHSNAASTATSIVKSIGKALQRGVRVIELDLWPSSHQSDAEIRQEGMPGSSVKLKKCLEAIKENAFVASVSPVIIILRITKTFRGMLCSLSTEYNSPQSLENRIILFTRPPTESLEEPMSDNNIPQDKEGAYTKLIPIRIEELEGELPKLLEADPSNDMIFSFTENHPENASRTSSTHLVRFTQKNLLAVYLNPNITGNLSSNYDPLIGWTHGAQMVACNVQMMEMDKQDLEKHLEKYIENYVWIMQGLLRANGGRGYVKKPNVLLDENNIFDPTAWRPVRRILKVKVYMGTGWHLDFYSEEFDQTTAPDFFTAIEIVGVPEDEAREKTLPAMDQWIPEWNQEFEFPLTVPELTFLVIKVSEFDPDRTHDFGGQTCLPVWELKRNQVRSIV